MLQRFITRLFLFFTYQDFTQQADIKPFSIIPLDQTFAKQRVKSKNETQSQTESVSETHSTHTNVTTFEALWQS
jgi:hypothetical protein